MSLHSADITLTSNSSGAIQVDAGGKPRMLLSGYNILWAPPRTDGGTSSLVTLPDGKQAIQVAYKIANDAGGQVRIQGQFTPFEHGAHVRFDIWGPDNLSTGGAMMPLSILPASLQKSAEAYAPTRWVRDANGGVPYTEPAGHYFVYKWPDLNALWSVDHANLTYLGQWSMHFPAQRVETGHFVAQGDVYFSNQRLDAMAAQYTKQPLSLEVWTDKNFNIWDNASAPLTLQTQTVNTGTGQKPVKLSWWARDYDGKIVAQGKDTKVLLAGEVWNHDLQFPAPKRGILFVEVDAKSGNDEVFRRTNLAVLPPHQFTSGKDSIFGLSSYFPYPSQDAVTHLLQRIGVRWLRTAKLTAPQATAAGIFQNYHSNIAPDKYQNEPEKKSDWITKQLKTADDNGAIYWEFGNEWNSFASKKVYDKNAQLYTKDWLPLINQLRQQHHAKVKMMSIGFSNDAAAFLQQIADAGEWDMLDAIAIHLGRGNFTPDYAGDASIWTFMGNLLKIKKFLAHHPEKPLYITEAYACTQPNSHWHDTLRHAAENVVLTYALAKAKGVKVMDWYQLNDGTWFAPNQAKPQNPEFSYGLLNNDLSPKPSLLGYNAIAEALDGATFVRELHFEDSNNKGLLFDTPRGSMTILWNRADGYILNGPDSKTYAAPEPWIDPWKTKVNITLPANAASVKVIDNIGREKDITAKNHQTQLTLDGAPSIVYGLNPQKMP